MDLSRRKTNGDTSLGVMEKRKVALDEISRFEIRDAP